MISTMEILYNYELTLTNGEVLEFSNSTENVEDLATNIFNSKAYIVGEKVINVTHIVSVGRK